MSFGCRLKELRLANGLTQAELAKKLKLSKANISKYESDSVEPNLDTLTMISNIFNVSINYLLDISENYMIDAPISKNIQILMKTYPELTDEELKKVIEYIDFLKTKREK